MKRFFDKVAQHLDKLDAESVRGQYKGLADEFAFLEAVLRTMGEGVLVVSEQGELAYANPAAENLAYLDFASSKGKPIASGSWYAVRVGQLIGWVSSKYVKLG